MTSEQVVREFFSGLDAQDLERACAVLAPDVLHTNGAGIAPLNGIAQVRAIYGPVVAGSVKTAMDVQRVMASGDVVSVIRDDVQVRPGASGESVEMRVPVASIIIVNDAGLISEWHDYWDIYAWARQTGRDYDFFKNWYAQASVS